MSTTPIIALDVPTQEDALELVEDLGTRCQFYKVGIELFTAAGPPIVRALRARGCNVFLDLKFHDIPNTVAGGVRNAVSLGASLVTVHASGGTAMLEAAVGAAGDRCGVLAVTVLTSLSATEVADSWGRTDAADVGAEVVRLARAAAAVGAHGIVCSGRETRMVREHFGDRLAVLVPGVRAAGAKSHDQVRIVTPAEAVSAGARYVVLGRMVTAAADRCVAMDQILLELGSP